MNKLQSILKRLINKFNTWAKANKNIIKLENGNTMGTITTFDREQLFENGSAIFGREPYVYTDCCNHVMAREKCNSMPEKI